MNHSDKAALTDLLSHLRCRQVRELAYACFGPSMITGLDHSSTGYSVLLDQTKKEKLLTLDRAPAPLLDFIAEVTSTRLGVYFETLWRFYWRYISDDESLLAHNLQVSQRGKTLGAFDFIVNHKQQCLHIEAALKFYLGAAPDLTNEANWLGPNASDNLAKKTQHMRSHQLNLSETPEGKAALKDIADDKTISSRFLIKGYLFAPAIADWRLPSRVNKEAVQGYWYYLDQLAQVDQELHVNSETPLTAKPSQSAYTIVPRNHWVAPVVHHRALQPLNHRQLLEALTQQITRFGRPKMVASLALEKDLWREQARFFVVPDQWPGTANPSFNT